ncbi:nuclear transport factor 2 family protein [Yinghuangia sp. ASG 101]|uniref:YybH family protein n=1 Tax=Yinghuangia sp. ASG 101 TaxID=2896848 RepID=UPI001E536685|nr:nuclear transport factor 2 family protein [Yinghuangia sp. ASG 101]UGQ15187.1 nuclear transport factor 2 family protein [Yinghuangia sp. ASG 101]
MTDTTRETAKTPEDLARLFVERANAKDADGLAALYAPDAVLAYPPGSTTVGHEAIRAVCERLVAYAAEPFAIEEPLPTVHYGDLALTSTKPADGTGGRVQVAHRQPDGTWLRVIDRPEAAPARP